jgi:hypothetical protein
MKKAGIAGFSLIGLTFTPLRPDAKIERDGSFPCLRVGHTVNPVSPVPSNNLLE